MIALFLSGLLWLTTAAQAAAEVPSKVDSLIQASTDTTLGMDGRRDLLKDAIKLDRTGKALHALARLRLEKGTTYSRQQARSLLTRALEREPDNGDYMATFAELLWRTGPRSGSYKRAREAISLDPKNVRAYYWAGRFVVWSWEMTFFTREDEGDAMRVAGDGDVTTGRTFAQRGYADMDVDVGIDYLGRALWLDADHWPSRVHLGLAYYLSREAGCADFPVSGRYQTQSGPCGRLLFYWARLSAKGRPRSGVPGICGRSGSPIRPAAPLHANRSS